jgi:DNA-binding transcriptional regulator YiaG
VTGSDIRSRRIRLGLSRNQLAHRLGVPAQVVEEWEAGASDVTCPSALSQILREEESVHSGLRAGFGDPAEEPALRR